MKECPSCKTKNRNDAEFCTECGADLKDVPATTDEWAAAAGSLLNKAKEVAATGAKKAKEAAQTGTAKVQKAMEDADKKAEATKAAGVSAGGWDAAVDTPPLPLWAAHLKREAVFLSIRVRALLPPSATIIYKAS